MSILFENSLALVLGSINKSVWVAKMQKAIYVPFFFFLNALRDYGIMQQNGQCDIDMRFSN